MINGEEMLERLFSDFFSVQATRQDVIKMRDRENRETVPATRVPRNDCPEGTRGRSSSTSPVTKTSSSSWEAAKMTVSANPKGQSES